MTQYFYIVAFGLISLFVFAFVGSLIFRRYLGRNRALSPIHDQMAIVQTGRYFKRRLLNGEECQLFKFLEIWIKEHPSFRLFAQVSLGEIIGSDDRLTYACVNAKRCDFVIIDSNGYAALVIEYQGSGHFSPTSDERDYVKQKALDSAGIEMMEVIEGFRWSDLEIELKAALPSYRL